MVNQPLVIGLFALLLVGCVAGDVTTYTTNSDWLAAIAAASDPLTFTWVEGGTPNALSGNGFVWTASVTLLGPCSNAPNVYFAPGPNRQTYTFSGPQLPYAFAVNVIDGTCVAVGSSNPNYAFDSNGVCVWINGDSGTPYCIPQSSANTQPIFFGMVSTAPISSFSVDQPYDAGSHNSLFSSISVAGPPAGGLKSDPIVQGFDGEVFDFKGVANRVFNIFSIVDLQLSSYFIAGLIPGETYTGAIGIKQGGVSEILFDLWTAKVIERNATDGSQTEKHITYPMARPYELANGGQVTRPHPGQLVVSWPLYSVAMKRIWEKHGTKELVYIDFDLTLKISSLKPEDVSGVFGQTYQCTKCSGPAGHDINWEDFVATEGADVFTDKFPQQFYLYNPDEELAHTPGEAQVVGVVHKRK